MKLININLTTLSFELHVKSIHLFVLFIYCELEPSSVPRENVPV